MCIDTNTRTYTLTHSHTHRHQLSDYISTAAFTFSRSLPKETLPPLLCIFLPSHVCLHTMLCFRWVSDVAITFPPVLSLRSRQSVWRAGSFWPLWGHPVKETVLRLSEPLGLLQPAWRAAHQISIVPPPGNAALMGVGTLAKAPPIYIKVRANPWLLSETG